jgi:uncharacterized damage-inducible protein DinB
MSEVKRIGSQLRRAFEGVAWHGPSVKEILSDVSAERAAARPLDAAHTIWELVLHIAAWERVVLRRLEGEALESVPDAVDWPQVRDRSEESWREALVQLERGNQALRDRISGLEDQQLDQIAAGTNYSIYFMLHGVIQHDLYHAGQIALLKRALV